MDSSTCIALLDAKIFSADTLQLSTLNIALKGGKVAALGYLPDDEEMTDISLKNHLIVPNAFNVLDQFSIMEGQLLVELLHHGTFDSSQEMVVARVSMSEFMFVLQELNSISTPIHLHLVLDKLDTEILTLLRSRPLPEGVFVGALVDYVEPDFCDELYKAVMDKTVCSLSLGTDGDLCSWLMAMFREKAPELMAQLFEFYSNDCFGFEIQDIALGKAVSFTAVAVDEPFEVKVVVKEGVIELKEEKRD